MANADSAQKIAQAVGRIAETVEKVCDKAVAELEAAGNETVQKIGQAVTAQKKPLTDANAILDALIGGDNGGPPLDDVGGSVGPATFLPTGENKPTAGFGAGPSQLASSTPPPLPDHVKPPE